MSHILIVEDHQDIFENIERKIKNKYPDFQISLANNCDDGLKIVLKNKLSNPVSLVILDLTFTTNHKHSTLKRGRDFINAKNQHNLKTQILVYTAHNQLDHIQPTIKLGIQGYVIKTHNSSDELLLAINKILNNETYFSQEVFQEQMKRLKYEFHLDKIDEQIIKFLPDASYMQDWENKITHKSGYLSYKSIKKRIDNLCHNFEVDNEKQLVLKLQRLAIL